MSGLGGFGKFLGNDYKKIILDDGAEMPWPKPGWRELPDAKDPCARCKYYGVDFFWGRHVICRGCMFCEKCRLFHDANIKCRCCGGTAAPNASGKWWRCEKTGNLFDPLSWGGEIFDRHCLRCGFSEVYAALDKQGHICRRCVGFTGLTEWLDFLLGLEKKNREDGNLKMEIESSSGENLGDPLLKLITKKAQEAYVQNRAYYKDAPPVTGGASAISLKKSLEAAIVQMEGVLSSILIEGEDELCHASARIQFKIQRVDIEVWETKGAKK